MNKIIEFIWENKVKRIVFPLAVLVLTCMLMNGMVSLGHMEVPAHPAYASADLIINEPANGATIHGTIEVQAQVSDVNQVQFYLQDLSRTNRQFLGEGSNISATTWIFSWNSDARNEDTTSKILDGAYLLYATAYDQTHGRRVTSSELTVYVANSGDDTSTTDPGTPTDPIPPTSTLTEPVIIQPKAASTLTGWVDLQAQATAQKVWFYAERTTGSGLIFLGEASQDSDSDWTLHWKSSLLTDGDCLIFVKAANSLGISATSQKVLVTLNNNISTDDIPVPEIPVSSDTVIAQSRPQLVEIEDLDSVSPQVAAIAQVDELENLTIQAMEISKIDSGTVAGKIVMTGQGPADTVITITIYSDPIVATTRVDENGNWVYTLDQSLPAGKHEVYLTVSDQQKELVGRSAIFSFLVEEAVAAQDYPTANTSSVASSNRSYLTYYIYGALGVVLVTLTAMLVLQKIANRKMDSSGS